MDGGGWEEVPNKKQQRRQQQREQQQHRPGGGSQHQHQQRRPKGNRGKGMAPPSMVPASLTVIVLVGTPGCGKSTFCAALNEQLAASVAVRGMPQPVRVSQDDLGSRKACEALSESALRAGHNLVIDRCNFDEQQRSTWLRIGRRFGAAVVAAFLNTPIETCKQRVMRRADHPTLGPSAESVAIVERFRRLLKPPRRSEGFSLIVEAGEDMPSVQAAAGALADHLLAAMAAAAPAPPPAAAAAAAAAVVQQPAVDVGAPVGRSFSMQAMEGLLAEPELRAPQRAAAAAALEQQGRAAAAAAAAAAVAAGAGAGSGAALPRASSGELEQARLDGELRALNRLAGGATPAPAAAAVAQQPQQQPAPAAPPPAAAADLLQQTREEICRLRAELGLGGGAALVGGAAALAAIGGAALFQQQQGEQAAGGGGMDPDAPAWQPSW